MKITLMLVISMFLVVIFFNFLRSNNPPKINCPSSEDMNIRFNKLYAKFGKGKQVPYIFTNGTEVNWQEIYFNMDYLYEKK